MFRRFVPALLACSALLLGSGGVHAQTLDPGLHIHGPIPFQPGPPRDFGLDRWWSMSVQFPSGQDSISASSPGDVVRVPWTNVVIPVGVQLTENGAASAGDWVDFSVQPQLCLTPGEAAAYPVQNEPWDWRNFSPMLGAPQGVCTEQPYGDLGSWYPVYDDGGGAQYPYSQRGGAATKAEAFLPS